MSQLIIYIWHFPAIFTTYIMRTLKTSAALLLSIYSYISFGFSPQPGDSINEDYVNWYNLSPSDDKILGAAVEKAYTELLSSKPSKKTIVVAVVDAGVDIYHEDLVDRIWINEDEIADNGIDDDKNGYIDDVHGWNFIGNDKGEHINHANLEITRIVRQYEPIFNKLGENIPDSLKATYEMYKMALADHEEQSEKYKKQWEEYDEFMQFFKSMEAVLKEELGKDRILESDIAQVQATNDELRKAKNFFTYLYEKEFTYKEFQETYDYYDMKVNYHLNTKFDPRTIIGDDITDMSNVYGNNIVKGPRCDHGTLVAGVIAANRNNGLGVNGIADSVKIMVLRTVPDGDEYDKDVAMSIIYAVDNGADIINMSFGKDYSPQKELVDKALKYAAEHNVLLVHAAGNDGSNSDVNNNFPADYYSQTDTLKAWLTVGANDRKKGKRMPAVFTNYGINTVDLFAPGVNIVSTLPESRYEVTQGTSFAGPVVTGVAALVWSRYPDLTAIELKEILMQSTTTDYYKKKVFQPTEERGKGDKVRFYELSQTGGIVNAYQALLLAEQRSDNKSSENKASR